MTEGGEQLRAVLDGYANFLLERELALPKHQPYLVCWVREFLHFAREHGGYLCLSKTLSLLIPWHLGSWPEASLRRRISYYNKAGVHLWLERTSPIPRSVCPVKEGAVLTKEYLGGLHHRYTRAA